MRWDYRATKEHLREDSVEAQRFSSNPSDFGASGEARGAPLGAFRGPLIDPKLRAAELRLALSLERFSRFDECI